MKEKMMDKVMDMMGEQEPMKMDKTSVQAKKDVLMELLEELKMAEHSGLKKRLGEKEAMKVSVMAKDEEGLKEGLEKAEEVLETMPELADEEESEEAEELVAEEDHKPKADVMEDEEEPKVTQVEDDEEESFFAKKRKA